MAVAPPLAALAESAPLARPSARDPHAVFIAEASKRFRIPEHWIRAVRQAESGGEPRAVSSAGAMGLMQIMPDTWTELRIRYRLGRDPFDPRDNILAGAAYLAELHARYGSPGFLAAYNAGPGRYEEYLSGRPLPAETRAYLDALAPQIGGRGLAPVTPKKNAANDAGSKDSHAAPLFISIPADNIPDTSGASAVRDLSAIAPRSDGLFVARARNGDRP
nr:lytic transglycosylase domain-containing protein [Shinella sp. NM-101]